MLAEEWRARLVARRWFKRCWCSPASPLSSCPGPCATRSRSIGSCRSRPAAGRCCSPGPTCRRTAIPKRSAPRWSSGIPELFGPDAVAATCGWSRSWRGWRRSAIRGWKPTRRSRGWAGSSSGTTSAKSRSSTRGSWRPRSGGSGRTGRVTVMREPGWELLHWALVAFGLIGLAVLALPAALGGAAAGDDLRRDHRDQRPARRLAAAGAGDDAAGRGPGRGRRDRSSNVGFDSASDIDPTHSVVNVGCAPGPG